jgi:hypothetical protein
LDRYLSTKPPNKIVAKPLKLGIFHLFRFTFS